MKYSEHYKMRLPERGALEGQANDPADIEDLTHNFGILDAELARQKAEDVRLEREKAKRTELAAHVERADNPHGVTAAQAGAYTKAETDAQISGAVKAHAQKRDNPHAVTKEQVGLGNVPNVATDDQTPTYAAANAPAALSSGETLRAAFGKLAAAVTALIAHLADGVRHITAAERGAWNGKTTVSFSRSLASGTKIGTITIDGTKTDLYCEKDTNTVYTHPTKAGYKHIPAGGASGQILKWSADGTAAWAAEGSAIAAAASAAKLTTARSLTIGKTAKSFDGSANVSWSLAEIGAEAAAQGKLYGQTIDLTAASYGQDTYYPVTGSAIPNDGALHRFKCIKALGAPKPNWAKHILGYSVQMELLNAAGDWGALSEFLIVLTNTSLFTNGKVVWYSQMTNSNIPVFWLRGGGQYPLYTDYPCTWTVRTASYSVNGQTVAPTTTAGDTVGTLSYNNWGGVTLPVAKGGTGATTAAAARANLAALGAKNEYSYTGMTTIAGGNSGADDWIRTTKAGLIPYSTTDKSSLGTSSWKFGNAYIETVHGNLDGTANYANSAGSAVDQTARDAAANANANANNRMPIGGGTFTGRVVAAVTYGYHNSVFNGIVRASNWGDTGNNVHYIAYLRK